MDKNRKSVTLAPRGDHSTDPFAAQDPSGWIPTNGIENLPPERQAVAVLFIPQPQYLFERIAHVIHDGAHRYWRIHGDQPGILTMPERVGWWYPLPDNPKKEGPQ